MRVFQSLDEARGTFQPCALTIGNFDGVHAGHLALMRHVKALGAQIGAKPSVLTFHPHPATVVAPERVPKLLTHPDERCALMEAEGIEQVLIMPFDRNVSTLSPQEFFQQILVDALGARAVTVGDNFHFGRKQSGGHAALEQMGRQFDVRVDTLPLIRLRGVTVSSSEIRRLLSQGNVSKAGRLLGRPYSVQGAVVTGAGRGKKQTVPTLNLTPDSIGDGDRQFPAHGVYITRTACQPTGRVWQSITNVGTRPTFHGVGLTIETFLLQALEGETPSRIRVEFLRRVREERMFPSAEELKAQILCDVSRAQAFFRRLSRVP